MLENLLISRRSHHPNRLPGSSSSCGICSERNGRIHETDSYGNAKLGHELQENFKIILLATHVVSDVESIADRILIMKAGELVADDTPEHLVHAVDGNNLEDVYMNYFGDKGEK